MDVLINFIIVPKKNKCIDACRDEEAECKYWTYNPVGGLCTLFKGCNKVDTTTCPTCVYGEKRCPSGKKINLRHIGAALS